MIMLFNFCSTFIFGFALLGCFALQAQVTVNASGGTATANYTNLSDAFAAINGGTHTGSINVILTASTAEPAAPTTLLASGQSSASYSSIAIYPSVAGLVVEGNAASVNRGVIELDGADNVSINGNLNNGTGNSRDLTIRSNAGGTTGSACIRLIGRTTGGLGTENINIRNCVLIGSTVGNTGSSGSTSTTTYGIYAAAPTSLALTGSGSDYDNVQIINNEIRNAYVGINLRGGSGAAANQNVVIRDNVLGNSNLSQSLGLAGMTLSQLDVATIENNEVFNISNTQATVTGIEVGGASSLEVLITRNRIHDLTFNGTGTNTAYGINTTNGDNHFISNNVIYNLSGINNNSATATTQHVAGIRLAGSNPGYRVFHNSVYLSGSLNTGSAAYGASYALIIVGNRTGFDVRNNIFANTTTSNATSSDLAAIWFTGTGFDFTASTFNNNAYWVGTTTGHKVVRVNTNTYTNVSDFRSISNQEANGVPTGLTANAGAFFPSTTNLRLADGTTNEIESAGAVLSFVPTDITGLTRPAFGNAAPDLGAFEFDGINPNAAPACNLSLALRAVNPLCAGSTGTGIVDSVPNGTAPFSYAWSSGATTAQATGLLNGNTAVTVTDANGCTVSNVVSITIPTALFVSGSPSNPRCQGGNDGLVDVFVTNATPPYSYIWNDGTTTESRFDLVAGVYSQTITDANGCFLSNSYTITDGPSFTATAQASLQGTCSLEGNINVSLNDQTLSSQIYTFVWNDGTTTQNRSGLANAGVYSLTITNDFNCTATASATLTIPTPLMASFADSSQASCASCADGSLTAQAMGGQGPYSYLWSNGQTTAVATGLMAGTNYNFTLTDDFGCQVVSDSTTVSFSVNLNRSGSELNQLQLFPNPAKHYLQITGLEANRSYRLRLINALGQTLSEQEIQGQNFEFNCSQLPQGTYYWQIWADNQQRSLIWVKQ